MKAIAAAGKWSVGEGRYIRQPSWENYGHVILRMRLSEEFSESVLEFDIGDDVLPEKYRSAIRDAFSRWVAHRAGLLGKKKAHAVVYDGSWYGIGSRHGEATEFALTQAARLEGWNEKQA